MVQQLDRSSNIWELGSHVTKIAMIAVSKFSRPFIPEFCIMEGEIVIEDPFRLMHLRGQPRLKAGQGFAFCWWVPKKTVFW